MQTAGAPSGVNITDYFGFPEEPVRINTREEAYAALGVTESPGSWFERDWKKVEKKELIFAHHPNGGLLRFAKVITLYAKREVAFRDPMDPTAHAKKTVEVLRETIYHPDGSTEERSFNSTVSETMYLREEPLQTIRRCVSDEELRLKMTRRQRRRYLSLRPSTSGKAPHLYVIESVGFRFDEKTGLPYEAYVRREDPKRGPNVSTYLVIFHFAWLVPKVFWRTRYAEAKDDGRILIFHWEDAEGVQSASSSPRKT